jgi:branched-chain amino acid transport system ATP-binding protein
MAEPALLAVSQLSMPIGAQTVLHDVTLSVPARGIVCVLGSNGVGKTTLMRSISGIYRQGRGSIRFAARDILNLAAHDIVRLGIAQAPEGRHIFANMTVAENLQVGSFARAARTESEREHVLELFPRLRERYRQKAGSLSGGEQQMLCIGRALMARPQLLLLDEPSLGLAPQVVRMIFDLIGRIRAGGTAVLLVEQNARAALAIADHAYVMEAGRSVLDGPADALLRDQRIITAYLGGTKLSH